MENNAANKVMRRRQNRIDAFSLIFQIPFVSDIAESDEIMRETAALFIENFCSENVDEPFILQRFYGVLEHLKDIDALISENTANWSLDRLNKVDLAILRLAFYELSYAEKVPKGVAVNEAVVLAKAYGTKESPSFINALLGKVVGYDDASGDKKL